MIDRSLDKSCGNSLLRSELIEQILDLESCEIKGTQAIWRDVIISYYYTCLMIVC